MTRDGKGRLVGACFIDLSKAFDTISHSKLLSKLPSYGIHGLELEWFTDYLFNRKAIVQYGQEQSEKFSLTQGVPQGSILGPLLFLIIFNDLSDVIENSKVIKYADDTVLYASGKTARDITEQLNSDLSRLEAWFHENELIINLNKGKTETLLFGTTKKVANGSSEFNVRINNEEITKTTSYSYLGVSIDSTLNMSSFFEKCYKKASSRLSLLSKLRGELDVKAAMAIYHSMILPTSTYCGILLLCNTKTQLDKLHSFHKRAEAIVNRYSVNKIPLQSVPNANKKRACILVRSCLDNKVIEPFKNYFQLIEHPIRTRNTSKIICLPKIKLEYARKSFAFTGAKVYNMLPLEACEMQAADFALFLKKHFS